MPELPDVEYLRENTSSQLLARRLGQIAIVEGIDAYVREQELGPDALAVTPEQLAAVIHDGRGAPNARDAAEP